MGTPFDHIADRDTDDAMNNFIRQFDAARGDIKSFVDVHLNWDGAGVETGFHAGSYNIIVSLKNTKTNEHVLVRFPFPGKIHEPWQERKVRNEVMTLKFLAQHTTIPVPRVYHWGMTEDSPGQLGPFIIEEFIEGESLGDLLKAPENDKNGRAYLHPDVDNTKLDLVYEQIAGFQLQLSRLGFGSIGAIDEVGDSGDFSVAEAPLTYDMNEVVAFAGFPADHFKSSTTFKRATDYFLERARSLQLNLETHRNIGQEDEKLTWKRYVARRCFEKLIPAYCPAEDDLGPFRLFCDDLRPSNMLADPETMHIRAVIDLEFTNVLPAQFAYDVPWWLVLSNPATSISNGDKQQFLDLFEPRMEQYIRAMKRAEAKLSPPLPATGEQPPRLLSARLRDSWDSGRFWFNLASRSSFDVDEIYWNCLHQDGRGEAMLDETTLTVKDEFLRRKKEQFEAYFVEKKADKRFNNSDLGLD
ncbi:hypothetical protein PG995_004174 [Apiospora arundinis]